MVDNSQNRYRFVYGWFIVGTFFLVMFTSWGMSQGTFGVLLKPLTEETGWSRTAASAAFSIHVTVSLVVGVLWGWLSDKIGVRKVLIATGILLGAGTFLAGIVTSMWQLYFYYGFIGGIGLGGTAGPVTSVASRWFEKSRGLVVGIGFAGGTLGTALLAILAEFLISNYGWRFAFQILSYFIWGGFLVGVIILRNPRDEEVHVHSSRETPTSTAENLDKEDSSLKEATHTKSFWILLGMMGVSTMIFFLVLVHLVPRAMDMGITSTTAVMIFVLANIFTTIGTIGGGALGDRIGPRQVFMLAMILYAVSLLWLIIASSLWMFFLFAAIFGLGNGAWSPQIPSLASREFGTRHMGAIWGALMLGAAIGGLLGPIMAGRVFDETGSYVMAFGIGAAIAGIGFLLSLMLALSMRTRQSG